MIVRPRTFRRCAGFTLLELLLALSLSALLFSVLALASNTLSTQWHSQNDLLQGDVEQALYLLRLERALQGMYPYQYRREGENATLLLMGGNEDSLIWVSTLSPGRLGVLNVWRLRSTEEGVLLDRAPLAAGFSEESMDWGSAERVAGFAAIRVRYAAYVAVEKNLEWVDEWPPQLEGVAEGELPRAVRVSFFREDRVVQEQDAELDLMALVKAVKPHTKQ